MGAAAEQEPNQVAEQHAAVEQEPNPVAEQHAAVGQQLTVLEQ